MAQILPFPWRHDVFEPDATSAMGLAFDKAIAIIDPPAESRIVVRELIAKRIIRTARKGQLDREQLCRSAVSGIPIRGRTAH